jgi:hypothetical protein
MPAGRVAEGGQSVALRFEMERAHFFDPTTGQALTLPGWFI